MILEGGAMLFHFCFKKEYKEEKACDKRQRNSKDHNNSNSNNNGSMGMGKVITLLGVDSAKVLTKLGVQQYNLRHRPVTSLESKV